MCEHKFLITAKAAAKLAEINNKTQVKMVNDKITAAASEGLNYVTLYEILKPATINDLQKAGYEVKSAFNAYNDEITIIRW